MPCNCENTACLEALAATCDDITLDLAASETGIWTMRYRFNGVWFERDFSVTDGDDLLIPNVLNENYNHEIEFYDTQGELVNDTCYFLNTANIPRSSGAGTIVVPSNAVDYLAYIVVSGTPASGLVDIGNGVMGKEIAGGMGIVAFTDARLLGLLVTTAETVGQSYTPENYTKAQNSTTFTFTNGLELSTDTRIILYTSEP